MHAGLRGVAEFGLRRVRLVSEGVVLDVEPTAEIGDLALNAVPTGEGMRIGNGFRVFVAFHDRHALVLAVLVRAGRDQFRAALRARVGHVWEVGVRDVLTLVLRRTVVRAPRRSESRTAMLVSRRDDVRTARVVSEMPNAFERFGRDLRVGGRFGNGRVVFPNPAELFGGIGDLNRFAARDLVVLGIDVVVSASADPRAVLLKQLRDVIRIAGGLVAPERLRTCLG